MRLKITFERSIRQQADILSPCVTVSARLNRVANDDAACSAPAELAQIQNRLFS